MKITRTTLYRFGLPLVEPFRIAIGEMREAPEILVRLETDEGLVGFGEGGPFPVITGEIQDSALAVGRDLARLVHGSDPLAIAERMAAIDAYVPGNPSVKAAFDMAFHDLLGKAAGLPLFRLLGGEQRRIETDQTIPIAEPEHMLEKARYYRDKGVTALKLKIGGGEIKEDILKVKSIREAVGSRVRLRLDANQGWDVPHAIHALHALAPYEIEFVEQPVKAWDIAGLARVRAASPIPIAADESMFSPQDALRIIREGAADFLNIKLMKAGGIHAGMKIARIAEAAGMRCMVGCMIESRVAITAAAHMHSACRNIQFADLDGFTFIQGDPVIGGVEPGPGWIELPEEPGLGLSVDPDLLETLESFDFEG